MHELSIAQALIEQVLQAVAGEAEGRIVEVHVEIGFLAGVDPGSLEMAFPVAAAGTLVEDAGLHVDIIPARITCRECGREEVARDIFPVCEACGSLDVTLSGGHSLVLKSIELKK